MGELKGRGDQRHIFHVPMDKKSRPLNLLALGLHKEYVEISRREAAMPTNHTTFLRRYNATFQISLYAF